MRTYTLTQPQFGSLTSLRLLLLAMLVPTAVMLFGQQESQYTFFMQNEMYYNPAAAGARGVASVTGLYRQQWAGFEGAPTSQLLSFSAPIVNDAVGFGIQLNHANKGIIDNTYASMSYNYKLKLSEEHAIRLGLQGSMQRWAVDFTDPSVRIRTENDNSIDLANNFSTWEGNVGFGALLELSDYFSAGVGIPHIYSSKISVDESKGLNGARITPHIYLTATGLIPLTSTLDFKPSMLVKVVQGAPTDFDINMGAVYAKKIMGGLGYRTGGDGRGESLDLLLFYQLTDKIGFGGAYDIGISELSQQSSGTFEVMGRFDLGAQRDDLVNPRFF
ncbi:MAG: PorP/SprF family type IX secretion system membrane protein [Saprospiraceae bacterium]